MSIFTLAARQLEHQSVQTHYLIILIVWSVCTHHVSTITRWKSLVLWILTPVHLWQNDRKGHFRLYKSLTFTSTGSHCDTSQTFTHWVLRTSIKIQGRFPWQGRGRKGIWASAKTVSTKRTWFNKSSFWGRPVAFRPGHTFNKAERMQKLRHGYRFWGLWLCRFELNSIKFLIQTVLCSTGHHTFWWLLIWSWATDVSPMISRTSSRQSSACFMRKSMIWYSVSSQELFCVEHCRIDLRKRGTSRKFAAAQACTMLEPACRIFRS